MRDRYIHWVLGGNGGCGKSVVSRLIMEGLLSGGYHCRGIDIDPQNADFSSYDGFDVKYMLTTHAGSNTISKRKFDKVLKEMDEDRETEHFVVDCGSSNYAELIDYMEGLRVLELSRGSGYRNVAHMVLPGGGASDNAFDAAERLVSMMKGEPVTYVAWHNLHFGEVMIEGKPIAENVRWLRMKEQVTAKATLERYHEYGFGEALKELLDKKLTFQQGEDGHYDIVEKARFRMLRDWILPMVLSAMEYLDEVNTEDEGEMEVRAGMARPDLKDLPRDVQAAIKAVAAQYGWLVEADDPVIVMGTAIIAMMEERGYVTKQGQENVVPMMSKPGRIPAGTGEPMQPMATRLPYPGENMHFKAPVWMKRERPRLRDTEEWHNLSRFICGVGKNLLLVCGGAIGGLYVANLLGG